MTYAIVLYFDPTTEARLRTLREALDRQLVDSLLAAAGVRPHLSLTVLRDVDPAALRPELRQLAGGFQPLSLSLGAVGTFPGDDGVVFVSPSVTAELLALHDRLLQRLDGLGLAMAPFYGRDRWVPHCTAAMYLPPDKILQAIDICCRSDVFGPVRLEQLGLAEYPPSRGVYAFPLGSQG